VYQAAIDPWMHYQGAVNPDPLFPHQPYYSFSQGPASFFMLETRRYRSKETSNATDPVKTMLGERQLQALLFWIQNKPELGVRFMVVASSVPFTKNWRFGSPDTWGGYMHERSVILDAMRDATVANGVQFVVISGDRHEFAATRFRDPDAERNAHVYEFSVSPLSMFYLPTRTYFQRDAEDEKIE